MMVIFSRTTGDERERRRMTTCTRHPAGGGGRGDDITASDPHKHTLETHRRSRCCVTVMRVKEVKKDGGREGRSRDGNEG